MGNYDLFEKRLNIFGDTKRERSKNKIQNKINRKAYGNLSYKDVLINDEPRSLICINVEKLDEKDIKSMPNESFATGDEVIFAGYHWLIIKVDIDDEVYMRGTMKRCDLLVRWQDIETLEIIERFCIDERPYTSNLNIDKAIVSPKKEFILKFRSDEQTRKIGVNKRFLIYKMYDIKTMKEVPIAMLVQAYNPVNTPNIIELNVVEDASFNVATDNQELMIADYINPTITVNIIPIPTLLLGDSIQIKYEFYQQNKLLSVIPKFESSDENIATVSETGLITAHQLGNVQINIIYQGAIGKLNINVVNVQISDKYIEITGVDSIKNGRTAEYSGFIFDNGVKQSEKVIFSLNTDGLVNPLPELEIIDDNNVSINVGNNDRNIDCIFKLICRDEYNMLIEKKDIEIVSLFK